MLRDNGGKLGHTDRRSVPIAQRLASSMWAEITTCNGRSIRPVPFERDLSMKTIDRHRASPASHGDSDRYQQNRLTGYGLVVTFG